MVGDKVSVAIEHLLKMAPRNQIVTDDVKWSRDGKRHRSRLWHQYVGAHYL